MSAWTDCVTAALLGTEKGGQSPLPGALQPSVAGASTLDREAQFLTRVGALALWRRAGWKPPANDLKITPAEAEVTRPILAASAGHLHLMLGGGRFAGVLREWLGEAIRMGLRVPPEMLPPLLDRARQDRGLRPLAMAVGGRRANWLAAHNPEWTFAAAESPELWETGSRDQRAAILRALRAASPGEARAKVESVWKEEAADVRAAFLAEFAVKLSNDDSPFLDAALDDRSAVVRKTAVDLLARLPDSPFVARMTERAKPLLVWKPGRLLSKASMEVALPAEPDPAGARDGLDPKVFGAQKMLGDRAVLLAQILSAAPLKNWTEGFSQKPAALIEAAQKSEFASAVATGWGWAAVRQRDASWAEALLDGGVTMHLGMAPGADLLTILPEEARGARIVTQIRSGVLKQNNYPMWSAVADHLNAFAGDWPVALGLEVIAAVREACEEGMPVYLGSMAESLLLRLPAALLPDAIRAMPRDKETAAGIIELLTFRQEFLAALRQP